MIRVLVFTALFVSALLAQEHEVTIEGKKVYYTSKAAKIPLKDAKGEVKGEIFYISYLKNENNSKRPVTFCFNGGPGSSSVWLHLGCFGPRRVSGNIAPPYGVRENPYSLLDLTDLVFLDPISTGYSKVVGEQDEKEYHGVEEDVNSMAEAICYWLSENDRWDSPKYLAGESYGTTRASALADKLHSGNYCYLNGVILVSCVLNFQTILDPSNGNDLPYVLLLPGYTAAALAHDKLSDALKKDPKKTLTQAEAFALDEYGPALLKGDRLSSQEKESLADKMSSLTGLQKKYLLQSNLRVPLSRFAKELLRDRGETIGRFDARVKGEDSDLTNCDFNYDPSFEDVAGRFTGAFNQYVRDELKYETTDPYRILNDVSPWNWGKNRNAFLNVGTQLKEVMEKNPRLKIFAAGGLYDLATPYFAMDYTFNHLYLTPEQQKRTDLKVYPGGHMMYLEEANLKALKEDLRRFYSR